MFRVSITLALAIVVSGMLPLLVQGYAWFDMTKKAGGIEQLASVMTDAEPCCICDMARDLNDSSRSNEKSPSPVKSIDVLKNLESTDLKVGPNVAVDSKCTFPIPVDALQLTGQITRPATPPPRPVANIS